VSVDEFIPILLGGNLYVAGRIKSFRKDSLELRMLRWCDLHRNGSEMIQKPFVISGSALDVFRSTEVNDRQRTVLFLLGRYTTINAGNYRLNSLLQRNQYVLPA
jgi:hypothetical protein